jgi:lysine 2,3-aminomutase
MKPKKSMAEVINEVVKNDFSSDDEPPEPEPPSQQFIAPDYISIRNGQPANSILPGIRSLEFLEQHFPSANLSDWCDWKWQLRNSARSIKRLNEFFPGYFEHQQGFRGRLPVMITPYYLSLINPNDPYNALGKTVLPTVQEYCKGAGESSDPLCEQADSPVPDLVHRYPDRVLLLASGSCAANCRYCTRTRLTGKESKTLQTGTNLENAFRYIENHREIRDVIISGGDPLILSDGRLDRILSRLRSISHVQIIRIGTKVPVVLPQRITVELTGMLKKYHPLFMSIHFTHPFELTPEVKQACERLADAGIPLGSQTVLLRGINDDAELLMELYHKLLMNRVRPYYLYQCDPVPGSAHFRTPVVKGLEIIQALRGHTSGYAIPHFVIDAPGGGGKIPLLPKYCEGRKGNNIILRNFENNIYFYPDTIE